MGLLRLLLMAAVVFVVTRWLRRALAGGNTRRGQPAAKKPWWDSEERRKETKPRLRTLQFRRDPHEVLGLSKGASDDAIEEAYERLLRENSPESVATMGEEIQEFARRKTE